MEEVQISQFQFDLLRLSVRFGGIIATLSNEDTLDALVQGGYMTLEPTTDRQPIYRPTALGRELVAESKS